MHALFGYPIHAPETEILGPVKGTNCTAVRCNPSGRDSTDLLHSEAPQFLEIEARKVERGGGGCDYFPSGKPLQQASK